MEATVIATNTETPLTLIGEAAGRCYDKRDGDAKARAIRCWKSGHMSVFEHASLTWKIEGISRACSHQLVRHRLASYTQVSQRYTRIPAKSGDDSWYVTPPSLKGDEAYARAMSHCADSYLGMLGCGIRPEDARFILPEATKTDLVVTMNLREFIHFYGLRSDEHAQWEIRELAERMLAAFPPSDEWGNVRHLITRGLSDV